MSHFALPLRLINLDAVLSSLSKVAIRIILTHTTHEAGSCDTTSATGLTCGGHCIDDVRIMILVRTPNLAVLRTRIDLAAAWRTFP